MLANSSTLTQGQMCHSSPDWLYFTAWFMKAAPAWYQAVLIRIVNTMMSSYHLCTQLVQIQHCLPLFGIWKFLEFPLLGFWLNTFKKQATALSFDASRNGKAPLSTQQYLKHFLERFSQLIFQSFATFCPGIFIWCWSPQQGGGGLNSYKPFLSVSFCDISCGHHACQTCISVQGPFC